MARRWGSVVFLSPRARVGLRTSGLFAALMFAFCARGSLAADSTWVKVGASGKLVYQLDDRGDRIMDFSTVGYYGGTVALPTFSSIVTPDRIVTVTPVAGDNLSNINTAIAKAAAMSVNSNGYRAVVQLAPGTYNISNSININTSGIIFRGSGQGGNPAVDSILAYTGTSQIDMVHIDSSNSRATSSTHNVVDKTVPVGSTSFTVDSTTGWNVGDTMLITRPSPQNWINDIGMNTLDMPWTAGSKDQSYERKITYIDQATKRVFFDAPMANSLESQYGGATVSKMTFNRTTNVGVENLRGNGQAVLTTPDDEAHANSFVVMQDTENSYARNVTGQHLVYATVEAGTNARNITLDGGTSIEPISQITGGRRYPFNIEGAYTLMKNMSSDEGRHEFINNSPSRGPNVFLDGVATHGHADSGTHQRWSAGTLWDNIATNTDLNVQNRYNSGTGHGWSGANMVIWNSKASDFYVQNPPTAQNWIIGSTGTVRSNSQYGPGVSAGYYDANNVGSKVTLNGETSLYRAQLAQRTANKATRLEYWVGDFDSYVNDGATDNVPVDATWKTAMQTAQPAVPVAGFDTPLASGNINVPFTFTFPTIGNGRIKSATLSLAVHSANGAATTDRIYLESMANSIGFNQLGTVPHFGNSDVVTMEFLPSSANAPLTFLEDGKLNLMVGSNHVVDWADLQFDVATKNLNWAPGATGNWDANTTANWNDGTIQDKYFEGDTVTFGNGPTNRTVNIVSQVAPGAVVINNAAGNDYSIGGAAIGGTATLTKTGTGMATLTSANTFTGATYVTGGTLKVSNAAALGSAVDEYDGTFVSNGGTLDINGQALGTQQERISISGSGVAGNGALVNSGADQTNATRFISLENNATIGGTGRIDVRGSSSTSNPPTGLLNLSGYTLTKTGTNKFALVATRVTDGNIVVNQGTLSLETTTLVQGTGTITLNAGTTLSFYDNAAGSVTRNVVLNGATVDNQSRATEIVDSNISFGGNNTFLVGGAATNVLTLNGVLSETGGARSLTKTSTGILALANANTFSGDTKVGGGVLRLDNALALQNSTLDYNSYGGTLSFGSLTAASLGGLKGNQSLSLITPSAAVALTVGGNNAPTLYTGTLSGGGSLTKIGNGTLALGGTQTYSGDTRVNAGIVQINGSERLSNTSRLVLAGGRFSTDGFNETLNQLSLLSNSTLDFGFGASTLRFNSSAALAWSGGLLVLNWDGTWGPSGGNGADRFFVGTDLSGLTSAQLNQVNFAGYSPGAMLLATGEIVPIAPARGDFNLDRTVDAADIQAMLVALTDLSGYQSSKGLLTSELLAVGDFNGDGSVTNADIQNMLSYVASGAGSLAAVPEPATVWLAVVGAAGCLLASRRESRRVEVVSDLRFALPVSFTGHIRMNRRGCRISSKHFRA
jgi:autotransporter-associated beta strand protein